ncbi:MAG: MBL fold metallo-hydrolase RNA specificity domain-containing protein [Candidatus ainarchaeum sp.]|nr:MBL fold metallo-hydrolase RNA specificity domain-containing protein [Candidatus ainarchaeum sp.]
MKITFYGGVGEVGRSCALLESNEKNLLLDAGIKLGEKVEYPLIPDDVLEGISNIAVSHAHLDHSGFLPHIYARSPLRPEIFATKPTRDLMGVLLADYLKIQKIREQTPEFGESEVNELMQKIKLQEFGKQFSAGFGVTFLNAGHILGSAMTLVEDDGKKVLYSGDISMRNTRILEGAQRNVHADALMVESTYAGKEDVLPSARESMLRFVTSINETLREGGFVLVPSFAVGRAQEILLALEDYMRSGVLTKAPIYIDGMILKAMRIYRQNVIYASESIKMRILTSDDDPFKSKFFHVPRTRNREDVFKEPAIIITTSGMLLGGPALIYLERMCSDPKNKLIIVGYQAQGTLGRKILEGEKKVRLGDREIQLEMKVESIRISGHADRNELLHFIKGTRGLKKVFLVHGEKGGELREDLEKDYEVVVPRLLEEHDI